MSRFRIGERVVRTHHQSSHFSPGKIYEVLGVDRDDYLTLISDKGRPARTCSKFYERKGGMPPITEDDITQNPSTAPFEKDTFMSFAHIALRGEAASSAAEAARVSPTKAVESAKAVLAQAEAALAVKEASDAFQARIQYDIDLAASTSELLLQIRSDAGGWPSTVHSPAFSKFRKELQPLANAYGFKIVLVGDKTTATLVQL